MICKGWHGFQNWALLEDDLTSYDCGNNSSGTMILWPLLPFIIFYCLLNMTVLSNIWCFQTVFIRFVWILLLNCEVDLPNRLVVLCSSLDFWGWFSVVHNLIPSSNWLFLLCQHCHLKQSLSQPWHMAVDPCRFSLPSRLGSKVPASIRCRYVFFVVEYWST